MNTKKGKLKMFKKLLCFSAAFILCLTSFIIPSYATQLNSADYTSQPIYYVDYEYNATNINQFSSSGVAVWGSRFLFLSKYPGSTNIPSSALPFYVFSVKQSNSFSFYICTESNINFDMQVTIGNRGSYNRWDYARVSNPTSYPDFNVYSYNTTFSPSISNSDMLIPLYDSYLDGLNAVSTLFGGGDTPSTDPIYTDLPDFNIQRGYAAYIDFGSDWNSRSISGTLTSSFPQYSSLISGDWDGTDNRRYFWTDALPSNTNFSSNVGNAIDWTKVPPYDLLQRSKNGIWFIQSNNPLNRYLVIVNPNQWRYGQNPTDDTINSPIKVSDLSGSTGDVQFFALNQKFDTDGTLVSAASDSASNNRTGTYDPDTDQWEMTDSSGNAADQVPGGESDTPVISSITDYIHNITSVLTNFANSVISLIQAPISHIAELIEAGSGFMASLRGMYSWLPVDIQGLVISALTVVIGIGVFKVFL